MKHPILSWGVTAEKNSPLYLNDGCGRDTYISYNNGGNFGAELRFLASPQARTGMNMMPTSPQRSKNIPQRLFYRSDGTGRDTYVMQNVNEKYQYSQNYKKMLRSHTTENLNPKFRYELPPLAKEKFRKTFMSQQTLIKRLSYPKKN